MRRYFFDVERDNVFELDAEGIELKSILHVRKYALQVLSEVLAEDASRLEAASAQVRVRDECQNVFSMQLALETTSHTAGPPTI